MGSSCLTIFRFFPPQARCSSPALGYPRSVPKSDVSLVFVWLYSRPIWGTDAPAHLQLKPHSCFRNVNTSDQPGTPCETVPLSTEDSLVTKKYCGDGRCTVSHDIKGSDEYDPSLFQYSILSNYTSSSFSLSLLPCSDTPRSRMVMMIGSRALGLLVV